MTFKIKDVIYTFDKISIEISNNKKFLTELDAAIGDGDHGINISKGFRVAKEKLHSSEIEDWGQLFKIVGFAIVSNVGGASGALYGTAFMKASQLGKGKSEINIEDFRDILKVAINGIKFRGKAEKGEKTMLDALIPAYEELVYGIDNNLEDINILKNMVDSAKKGVENTKLIIATKGRASYLGDRSLGHQDPGATSSLIILEVINNIAMEMRDNSGIITNSIS